MPAENPHFCLPFEFVTEAGSETVEAKEQDSTEDLIHQVLALFLCPVGYRDELPEFGMPSPLFQQTPLDLDEQREAVARWVPGVDVFISEGADIIDAAVRHMQVNISESSNEA